MSDQWEDMLSRHPSVDPKKMLDYLDGKLSEEDKRAMELQLAESDFEADAMEGLSQIGNKARIGGIVTELNEKLHRRTRQRRKRLFRNGMTFPLWLAYATIIIIMLVVIGFIILRRFQASQDSDLFRF
jgi:anti-sigma factor RsiW